MRSLRTERGYSQRNVSTYLDVREATVSDWERGKNIPDANTIGKLATLYGVSTEDFYEVINGESELGQMVAMTESLEALPVF